MIEPLVVVLIAYVESLFESPLLFLNQNYKPLEQIHCRIHWNNRITTGLLVEKKARNQNGTFSQSRSLSANSAGPGVDGWRVYYGEKNGRPMVAVGEGCRRVDKFGRFWSISGPNENRLIVVRRVQQVEEGVIIKASRPLVVGSSYR